MNQGTWIFSNSHLDTGATRSSLPEPLECFLDRNKTIEKHHLVDLHALTSRRQFSVKRDSKWRIKVTFWKKEQKRYLQIVTHEVSPGKSFRRVDTQLFVNGRLVYQK